MAGLEDHTLRIVLVGKTGSGKSATGNTILGNKIFTSSLNAKSVTEDCQKAERAWKDKKLLVVDTPGLFDTERKLWSTYTKISQCVFYSSPGPHAIILVVPLGRLTEEDHKTLELIKVIFGKPAMKHMIVLFTCKDHLEGQDLSTYIAKADKRLKSIITECDLRVCAFDNKSTDEAEKEAQVQELVGLMEAMVQENGGAHFSDPIYKCTEKIWQQVEKALNETSAERAAKEEKVKERYEGKEISRQEMEKQMASIKQEYEIKMRRVKERGEENTLEAILQWIGEKLSKKWRKFWE